jgi:hypothetical protein
MDIFEGEKKNELFVKKSSRGGVRSDTDPVFPECADLCTEQRHLRFSLPLPLVLSGALVLVAAAAFGFVRCQTRQAMAGLNH